MKYLIDINKIISNKQKTGLILLILLMFSSTALELISLNVFFVILKYFSNFESLSSYVYLDYFLNILKKIAPNYSMAVYLISIFFIVFLLKTLIYIYFAYKHSHYIAHCKKALSERLFVGYLNLPKLYHLRSNLSETIKNITVEVNYFVSGIENLLLALLEIIVLLGISFYLITVDAKTVLILLTALVIFSIFFYFLNIKPIIRMGKERVWANRGRIKYIYEGLSGNKAYAITNTKNFVSGEFAKDNNKLANIETSFSYRKSLPKPLYEVFVLLLLSIALIYGLSLGQNLQDFIPKIGIFLMAGYRLVPSFSRIFSNLQTVHFDMQSSKKLRNDYDLFTFLEKQSATETTKDFTFKNSIELKNVNFTYNKNKSNSIKDLVFKNINLKIDAGSKIGIMGESGVGKSTLLDIIMGLMPVTSGSVLIDNEKVETIGKSWQKNIGCVPQNVFINDESIKKNIAFGIDPKQIDDEKIEQSISLSNIKDFCNQLKFGINTLIGQNGSRISGGQKQRIGIARAIYHNPNVLIFDEATTALDEITEKRIIDDIFKNFKSKTIIFVSHKKENLKYCERILKIENNTIKE